MFGLSGLEAIPRDLTWLIFFSLLNFCAGVGSLSQIKVSVQKIRILTGSHQSRMEETGAGGKRTACGRNQADYGWENSGDSKLSGWSDIRKAE